MSFIKLLAIGASLALLVGFALACGGDNNGGNGSGSGIRVERGLGVAPVAPDSSSNTGGAGVSESSQRVISDLSLSSLPSPLWQMSTNGLTVQGYGLASAPADQALVYFYFSSGAPKPVPLPPSTSIAPAPITEESLRPIIEAIKGQGIADADIEVTLQPVYYQSDFSGSATIRVRVRDLGKVDGVIQAVQQAAGSVPQLTLNSANVQYTLADCSPLEQEAMKAAAEDARSRADLLARILGVGLGELIGATNWSYSPFGYPGCGQDNVRILSVVERGFIPGQSQEVQVSAALGLTFAIR